MNNAYVIGHITVKDQAKWAELILRGKLNSVLSGGHSHTDTVVIRFPNLKSLNSWFSSKEYQALIPLRQEAAELELLSFEE